VDDRASGDGLDRVDNLVVVGFLIRGVRAPHVANDALRIDNEDSTLGDA
jgi:hypothetical protein